MKPQSNNIVHHLSINEVGTLEVLVKNAINKLIKERPESINEPDWFDEHLQKLLEKLSRCFRGELYESPHSDEANRLAHLIVKDFNEAL